ncbi:AIPR family protein [Brevibacterium antiquum]|uniref:AIPR protein n=1 Tax=Brevibacterium antiquum TaxID=234835 RepID=A0A2H1JVA7_9MICO|nr:AIPR family protein [Brevibacterium antiquum]SMX91389.1 AIPR protein [Brevibacterium antiquum]
MNDFHAELENDIALRASGQGIFQIQAFAEELGNRLQDAEEMFDLNIEPVSCHGRNRKRLEILGYAEDGGDDSLIVLVGKYFGESGAKLNKTDADKIFDFGKSFLIQSEGGYLVDYLEESSKEYEYAEYFKTASERYEQIRFFLITDATMSDRIKHIPDETVAGLRSTFEIWDLNRFQQLAESPSGKEDTNVDFTEWMPEGLPMLASQDDSDNPTFVGIIPGTVLAEVYRRHGTRLLESNVRTFLSARGKVNRGIQQTLKQNPEMFLAFNNGLSTTASEILSTGDDHTRFIESITNWQIVNGGQTTASLAHYLKSNSSNTLDDVYVQMKLVLVASEEAAERVSEISRYANNQNKVSEADFFSNSEYHRHMSRLSAKVLAPRARGAQYSTRWFYERTRGEFDNERANRTVAQVKVFDLEVPKSQKITKTDWAKYLNAWDLLPHLVSKGAQSNFLEFAKNATDLWEKQKSAFNEEYFRNGVAKAILYSAIRRTVAPASWYESGYLANIVAYTMAKIAYEIPRHFAGSELDFSAIWKRQELPETMLGSIDSIAETVLAVLTAEDRPQANVTQWAKQQACWERVKRAPIEFRPEFKKALVDKSDAQGKRTEARKLQAMDNEFEDAARVLAIAPAVWEKALSEGVSEGLLSSTNVGIIEKLRQGSMVPTARQSKSVLTALQRLADFGVVGKDEF